MKGLVKKFKNILQSYKVGKRYLLLLNNGYDKNSAFEKMVSENILKIDKKNKRN